MMKKNNIFCMYAMLLVSSITYSMHVQNITQYSSQQEKNNALVSAIQNDDVKSIENAIKLGADVDACDENGNSSLHHRILSPIKNKSYITKLLVQQSKNIDMRNNRGFSPLLLACMIFANPELQEGFSSASGLTRIKNLLMGDANTELFDPLSENYPLHYAAQAGSVQLTQLLLEFGANPNVRNKAKKSPLALSFTNARGGSLVNSGNAYKILCLLFLHGAALDDLPEYMTPIKSMLEHKTLYAILSRLKQDDFTIDKGDLNLCVRQCDLNLMLQIFDIYEKNNKLTDLKNLSSNLYTYTTRSEFKSSIQHIMFKSMAYLLNKKIKNYEISPSEIKEFFKFIQQQDSDLETQQILTKTICKKSTHESLLNKLATHSFSDILLIAPGVKTVQKRKGSLEKPENLFKKIKE